MHNLEVKGKGINYFVAFSFEGKCRESLIGVVLLKVSIGLAQWFWNA